MEKDESVFVYKTIKNKQPKKIGKGVKVQQIRNNLEQEFLARGMGALSDFNKIYAQVESAGAKEKLIEERKEEEKVVEEHEEDHKQPEESTGPKVPEIKLKQGDGFIEDQETIEYLRKVRFLKNVQKKQEGKDAPDEDPEDIYLNSEQKMLKSILKKSSSGGIQEENLEPVGKRGRRVKASEIIQGKRKAQEGSLISGNIALRSGIDIPETQEAKQRREEKEEKEAKETPWKALMETENAEQQQIEKGGYIPFKEFQEYSRENIVIYKRIGNYMVRWIVTAGKVFDKHGHYFIPIRIVGVPMHQRSTVVYSIIYLEMMKFPRSAIAGKEFESIWPFLLYLLNNWIRHQFTVMGFTSSKDLEQKILERKRIKHKETLEGKTMEEMKEEDKKETIRKRNEFKRMSSEQRKHMQQLGLEEQEAERYEEILNFSSEIEYDDDYDI